MDWWMEKGVSILIGGVIMAMVVAIPLAIIESHKPTIELRKDRWDCSKEFEYTTTVLVPVTTMTGTIPGTTLLPTTEYHKDCVQWTQRGSR